MVTVSDSTFIDNSATGGGGGICDQGTLIVIDSTLSGNSAGNGGGIFINTGTASLQNTIVAGNTASSNPDISGSITTDNGYNLLGTALEGSTNGTGDVFSDAPLLSSLGNYGGPTQTMLPEPGSPAIGAGGNSGGPSTDQRGFARSTGTGGDIGADEGTLFTVTTTADSGAGSLRSSITDANSAPGTSVIDFNISGSAPFVITVGPDANVALPAITQAVIIDGTSQPGYTNQPIIQLIAADTLSSSGSVDGLQLSDGASTVKGLIISNFSNSGIEIDSNASGSLISSNWIGTDTTGASTAGNGTGIFVDNTADVTIGGSSAGAGNVVSGNLEQGVLISGLSALGNVVAGNYVGTDATGTAALGNGDYGVLVSSGAADNQIGGTSSVDPVSGDLSGAGNVIAANGAGGIDLDSVTGTLVAGNFIGTDVTGTAALANGGAGIVVIDGARGNTIGGTSAGTGNVLSGNDSDGVDIRDSGTSGNVVQGNFIGTDATGLYAEPNGGDGVNIYNQATDNTIGGTVVGAGNIISGNDNAGITISAADDNQVAGNYIGTDIHGTHSLANGWAGVNIQDAEDQNTGTFTDAANNSISGNSISGNVDAGVTILGPGSTGNVVAGNIIGLNAAGAQTLPNANYGGGVDIYNGATQNTIGGTSTAARNIITGNHDAAGIGGGVEISGSDTLGTTTYITSNNVVEGNYIGTDPTGAFVPPGAPSYEFNGGDVSVTIPQLNTANGAQNTASFWMYWDGDDDEMPIAFSNITYDLQLASGYFGFNTDNSDLYGTSSAGLANSWHYITAVFTNGDVTQNQLWIDGQEQSLTQEFGTTPPGAGSIATTAQISGWVNSFLFVGRLQEVAFFNRALSSSEIQQDYLTLSNSVLGQGPSAYYRFDETSGSVAGDATGDGNDGSISNSGVILGSRRRRAFHRSRCEPVRRHDRQHHRRQCRRGRQSHQRQSGRRRRHRRPRHDGQRGAGQLHRHRRERPRLHSRHGRFVEGRRQRQRLGRRQQRHPQRRRGLHRGRGRPNLPVRRLDRLHQRRRSRFQHQRSGKLRRHFHPGCVDQPGDREQHPGHLQRHRRRQFWLPDG